MDESMELRFNGWRFWHGVFDAGEFHVGFGIAVPSDDETTEFSIEGVTRNGRTPFRHSLAVPLYGDNLRGRTPLNLEAAEAFTLLLRKLIKSGASSRRPVY